MVEITPEWIRDRLAERGGTKRALADFIGVTPDAMSKILSGARELKSSEVLKMLNYFKVDVVRGRPLTDAQRELLEASFELDDKELRFLLNSAKANVSEPDRPQRESHEVEE